MKEVHIETIEEFLRWINNIKVNNNEEFSFEQPYIFYRGQADSTWAVAPGIFRKEEIGVSSNESTVLFQARKQAWQYVSDCHSELEQMVKFQHAGLNTRLLDFTSNPLVALYFACVGKEQKCKDGCVYIHTPSSNTNSDVNIAKLMAKIVFNEINNIEDKRIERWVEEFEINTTKDNNGLKSILSRPCFFEGLYNNKRIAAQRGAFLMAPLCTKMKDKEYWLTPKEKFDYRNMVYENKNKVIFEEYALIDCCAKEKILQELSCLGFDESTLFPDMPHIMEAINNGRFDKSEHKDYKYDI